MSKISNKKFPCTGCGCCCKRLGPFIHSVAIIHKNPNLVFPYKFDKKGVCEKLVDNKCSIYSNRPIVCQVDKMLKYEKNTSKKEWYKKNAKICNNWMDEDNIPETLRIK